jgi:hypothetical protein
MPVVSATLGEGGPIGRSTVAPEQFGILTVPGDTIALQIGNVASQRGSREAGPDVSDHPRLDQNAALTLPSAHPQHGASATSIATRAASAVPGDADTAGLVR